MMKTYLVSQLKKAYSLHVKMLSKRTANKKIKQQVVYLLSFPNNNHGLIEALSETYQVIVCYTDNMKEEAESLKKFGTLNNNVDTFSGLTKTVKAVSESQIVLADNYFAFLGDIVKRKEQCFFQLWHATGAIKQFGLEDKKSALRPKSDQERFKRVYQSFDYFVVGSKAMGDVFIRSYEVRESQMCYLGFPRTDYLLKNKETQKVKIKKIILYLPTYREKSNQQGLLDMVKLKEHLGDDYELLVKTHPHAKLMENKGVIDESNITWLKETDSADELLLQTDILITDYSSVAFDYGLINPLGKLIFYWYDESDYRKETGIQTGVEKTLPNSICHTLEEVLAEVKNNDQDLSTFNRTWNTYNDGNATSRLLDVIAEKMDGNK